MTEQASTERLDRSTVLALVAMCLGVFVVANDFTALSVAVVQIEDDLGTSLNRVQWVINAYTVVFGVLIVTGGRLADMFGRRLVFLIGAAVFGLFSLLGGLTDDIGLLIGARAVMGVGAAMMWPSVLGMMYEILPEARASLAGGLVIGVAGLGNALGPLTAGVLTDTVGWRCVFFVNVPVALVAIVVTLWAVPRSTTGGRQRVDYLGIATLSAAVILLLVGLDTGTTVGFDDPGVIATIVVGALLLPVFVVVQRRMGDDALVPRRITRSRRFTASVVSVVPMAAVLFGALVYVPQYTEKVLGWDALAAGAGLLPMMLVFALVSLAATTLYDRLGARPVVGAGAVCLALGAVWLAATIGSGYAVLVPGLLTIGVGIGLYFSALTTVAVTAVADSDASLAGGVVYMANIAAGSLWIGANTAVVLASADFAEGIRRAFVLDASLGVVGAAIAVLALRGDEPA
ncbi:EmrB/QacA subfamily drug resistance transporter [Mumia flava]|uniref:EmrB/QacA subfamily drug resistance transporter n=1 Tax=Mumia flava TaxID=1348852 RepID=A0A0B2BPB5_9ACTN|nr:MFS transporter [Mumia flava]PJJ56551.1 EmrB/QacA subfamily drug resistance transporter [Mumia flava]